MPFAPKIRKQILSALEDSIIPSLRGQDVALGRVTPPFHFPAGIKAQLIRKSVPRVSADSSGYPVQNYWPKADLVSTFQPYIGVFYEGTADEHTMVSASQATKAKVCKGIYRIRLQSPSVLLFPPGAPRKDGGKGFWDGTNPLPASIKVLWLDVEPTEIFIHSYIQKQDQPPETSHSLLINDGTIMNLSRLFIQELQGVTSKNQEIAQAILLPLMLCLQYYLQTTRPRLANTSFTSTPKLSITLPNGQPHQAWQEALIYIQLHLHENLSLSRIAPHVGFSSAHLRRLFHQFCGIPVMRYVRLQRIAAAKEMLTKAPENISEIADMVGFSSANVFRNAFRQETGISPSQFRQQHREGKTNATDK